MIDFTDKEDWENLDTLTGNALHVPKALLGLLSTSESEFDESYWQLENHVVVQGDLFSAAKVLPQYLEEIFLVAKYKYGVLELLFQIGNGSSEDKELEELCYTEVVGVLSRLSSNNNIDPEICTKVKEELIEIKESNKDRANRT